MKRSLGRLTLLAMLCIASAPAWAERVWSVEVVTGDSAPEQVLPELAKRWPARIEARDDGKSLLVGAWEDQADARQALADIKRRFPLSFVRSADRVAEVGPRRSTTVNGSILGFRESNRGLAEPRALPGQAARVQRDPDPWSSRIKRDPADAASKAGDRASTGKAPPAAPAASAPSAAPRPLIAARPPQAPAAKLREGPAVPKPRSVTKAPLPNAHESAVRQALAQGDGAAALAALRRAAQAGAAVSPALLDEVLLTDARGRFAAALQQQAGPALARMIDDHPDITSCGDPASAWAAADVVRESGAVSQAAAVMSRMLDCDDANIRLATLEKSFVWQVPTVWRQWLAREQARTVTRAAGADLPVRLEDLIYRDQVRQVVNATSGTDEKVAGTVPSGKGVTALPTGLLGELEGRVERRKDAGVATLLGWLQLQGGGSAPTVESAGRWFTRALEWEPGLADAQEGLIRVSLAAGRAEAAWQAAQQYRGAETKGRLLAQEAALALGSAAYASQDFAVALQWLGRAEALGTVPTYAARQIAWAQLAVGQGEQAARRFADSYRAQPDEESARGVVASFKALGRLDEVRSLPKSVSLDGLLASETSAEALSAKLFQAAARIQGDRSVAPGSLADAALRSQSASALWAPHVRRKTGSEGRSQLAVRPADSYGLATPILKLSGWLEARTDRFTLDAGRAAGDEATAVSRAEEAQLLLRIEDAGRWWEAELGRLALRESNASLPARTHARLTAGWEDAGGALTLTLSRQPVRESLLSWVGVQRPEGAWGAVLRDRVQVEARRSIASNLSVGGQWQQDRLTGTAVAANRQQNLVLQAGVDLGLPEFDYAVLGLAASSLRSARNLSYFTPGHGGYFSPARQWRVGPTLDFMTREAQPWMMKGRLAWGRTGKREDEAPVLPLADDGRVYPALRERASAWEAEMGLVWQWMPHVQVGLWASRRHASEYDDRAYVFSVRLLDKARSAVLSRDLPQRLAGNWL